MLADDVVDWVLGMGTDYFPRKSCLITKYYLLPLAGGVFSTKSSLESPFKFFLAEALDDFSPVSPDFFFG